MPPSTTRAVGLLNLRAQHEEIREEVAAAVRRVVDSQQFILGKELESCVRDLAAY